MKLETRPGKCLTCVSPQQALDPTRHVLHPLAIQKSGPEQPPLSGPVRLRKKTRMASRQLRPTPQWRRWQSPQPVSAQARGQLAVRLLTRGEKGSAVPCGLPSEAHNLPLTMRKPWGPFSRINGRHSSKCQRHKRQSKAGHWSRLKGAL